jgi:hypothetical protein
MPADTTDTVLEDFMRDAMSQAQQLIQKVVGEVIATFEARATDSLTGKERQLYQDLLIELRKAQRLLAQSFVEQFNQLVKHPNSLNSADTGRPMRFEELKIVDDDSIDEDVEVSQLVQQIEASAEWEIRDLTARLSALKGTDEVDAKHNPLRPELFGRSLQRAVQSMSVGGEERLVLLRSFGSALSTALKDTYSSYNQRLKARNIEPAAYGIRPARAPGSPLHAVGSAASAALDSPGGYQPIGGTGVGGASLLGGHSQSHLERLFQGRAAPRMPASSGFSDTTGGPSSFFGGAMGNEVLRGMLHQVAMQEATQYAVQQGAVLSNPMPLNNVIYQFREDLLQAAQRPIERLTIDVVAMMFDHILADSRLLPVIKAQLGRLQIPVLRVALNDATLFSSRSHPTRKLINRIASYSSGFDSAENERFKRFVGAVGQSVETIISSDSEQPEIFSEQLQVIEAVIGDISAANEKASLDAVNALERAELRTVMKSSVAHHIATMLATVEVEDYLRDFLREPWALVLVESILQHGEDSEDARTYKQTASDLVWSVQPKVTAPDRTHLLKLLPGLVKSLRAGLALLSDAPVDQQRFFAQLMTSHAKAVKAEGVQPSPANAQSLAWQDKVAQAWGGTLELDTPHQIGEVLVNRSEKDVAALIDTPDVAAPTPTAARASISSANLVRAESLTVGTWYEMLYQGNWVKVQLFWKSPKGLFYMFSSNVGGKSHSITRRALDKMCSEGAFKLYESEGLIDRAVAGVMASSSGASPGASPAKLH